MTQTPADDALTAEREAAAQALRAGRVAEAEKRIDALLSQAPEDPTTLNLKVAALAAQGAYAAALPLAERAAALRPADLDLAMNHAAMLVNLGRPEQALPLFDKALAVEPDNLRALVDRARVFTELKRFEAARTDLERASKLAPAAAPVWSALAEAAIGAGAPKAALGAIERARALGDRTARAAALLGRIQLTLGAPDAAAAAYEEAVAAEPELLHAYTGLAAAETARQRPDAALAATDALLAQAPTILRSDASAQIRVAVLERLGGRPLADARPAIHPHAGANFIAQAPAGRIAYLHGFADHAGSAEALQAALGSADLVYNNWADADAIADDGGDAPLRALLASAADAPLLNAPDAVAATSRAANAEAYAQADRFIVPTTRYLPTSMAGGLRGFDTRKTLALVSCSLPMMLQPAAALRDGGAVMVETETALDAALKHFGDVDFYAIAYHDCRGQDGRFRRYRIAVVDGRPIPTHMHVPERWTAPDPKKPRKREPLDWEGEGLGDEERRFLEAPETILGSAPEEVFAPILARTRLDIYGIDFGLAQDGRIVVFDVNAATPLTSRQLARRRPYLAPYRAALNREIEALFLARAKSAAGA